MKTFLRRFINFFYTTYSFFIFFLPTPIVVLYYIWVSRYPDKPRLLKIFRIHRIWIAFWENMTGTRFEIIGRDKIKPDQSYVFIANHCNLLDIILVGSYIRHPWKPLIKKELTRVPMIGWLLSKISIPVDRSNKESRKNSLLEMIRQLRDGISILIFPEGTRNRTQNPLKSFYPGAFRIAISAQTPILPVIITNTRKLQPIDTFRLYPGKGNMEFLDPISTEGYSYDNLKQFQEKVWNIMEEAIRERDVHFKVPMKNEQQTAKK